MNFKKRIGTFILCALVTGSSACSFPIVFAAETIEVGDRLTVDGNTVTVYKELYTSDFSERYLNYYVLQSESGFALYDADTDTQTTPFFENVYFSTTNGRYVLFSDLATRSEYGVMDRNGTVILPLRKGFYTLNEDDTVSYLDTDPDGTIRKKKVKLPECTEIPATEPYEAELFFHEATPFESKAEIGGVTLVYGDGTCADLDEDDVDTFLSVIWNFNCERAFSHVDESSFSDGYYLLRSADGNKTVTVYDGWKVLTAQFGQAPNGFEQNYVIYRPMRGNAVNALLTADRQLREKYRSSARDVTDNDAPYYPDKNLLSTEGCDEWAKEEIEKAAAKKLLPYDLANNYTAPITRLEFCKLALSLTANDVLPSGDSVQSGERARYVLTVADESVEVEYSDCSDRDVKALSAAGIIRGVGNDLFAPERSITREEAATILYRLASYRQCGIGIPSEKAIYSDLDSANDWAIDAIDAISSAQIMNGVSDTEFYPKGIYTRQQAIATILRLSNYTAQAF